LIAYDADRFRYSTTEMRAIVDMWFAEEAEHARLLGCAVKSFMGDISHHIGVLPPSASAGASSVSDLNCRSCCSRSWSARPIIGCCEITRLTAS
jgi:hypothetical protein